MLEHISILYQYNIFLKYIAFVSMHALSYNHLLLDLVLGVVRLDLEALHILPLGLVLRLDPVSISYSTSVSAS